MELRYIVTLAGKVDGTYFDTPKECLDYLKEVLEEQDKELNNKTYQEYEVTKSIYISPDDFDYIDFCELEELELEVWIHEKSKLC